MISEVRFRWYKAKLKSKSKIIRKLSFAIGYAFILTTGGWMVGYQQYLLAIMLFAGVSLIIPALDDRLK